jgi:hypothetical protein
MFTCGFTDHDVAELDHSIVGFSCHAASNAGQHVEPDARKRGHHLGDAIAAGLFPA